MTSPLTLHPPHQIKSDFYRDPRVDLVRGLALLVIFSDHVLGNPVRYYMPISLGFSDMAEIFIFASGYLNGISPSARTERGMIERSRVCDGSGRPSSKVATVGVRHAFARSVRLYAAILLIHLLTWVILEVSKSLGMHNITFQHLSLPLRTSATSVWHIVTLQSLLFTTSVLATYLVLVWIVPFVRPRLRDQAPAVIALSIALYASVQFWPQTFTLPFPWANAFYFNPFAWQMLFILGMAWSSKAFARPGPPNRHAWLIKIAVLVLALFGLEIAFMIKSHQWIFAAQINVDKPTLAIARVAHFFCLLLIGRAVLPRDPRIIDQHFLRHVIVCGQHPLTTYCTGSLLATVGSIVLSHYGTSVQWTFLVNVVGWAGCLLVAHVASRASKRGTFST